MPGYGRNDIILPMNTLTTFFRDYVKDVTRLSRSSTLITEDNVYQEAAADIRPYLDKMAEALVLPGSGVEGLSNVDDLYEKAMAGKSCLLLTEHYSNMDLSLVTYLLAQAGGRGKEISDSIIAIAGMKLNEENPVVSAFASAYSRIVICPSRSLQSLDAEKDRAEIVRAHGINRAAMKAVIRQKYKGHLILIFPSGTRYRPGDPSTKRGVREIDSYIRSFDYMCPVAINGQVLHIRPGDMMDDEVSHDLVRISFGPVIPCGEFRDRARAQAEERGISGSDEKKQAVADAIMEELERMHLEGELKRQAL